ncbi:MAG: hypothetical protein ABSH48_26900, partial [Verrucomicrobiota bacterium]
LLPVQLGPDKEPFVDIAQHWYNKAPITCPRNTGEAWGGKPDAPCPVCDVSDRLSQSSSEEISGIGFKARCNLRVRGFCLVFEMEDHRGNVDEIRMEDILNPYEFDMYQTTWDRFKKFQSWAMSGRRGGNEASEWGVMDIETGCDLLATQGGKGVTLDRCDPSPIFPLTDPKFDEYIAKIWSRIQAPRIAIPSEKQLLEFAVKIEEFAEHGGISRRGRGEDDDRGRGRRGRAEYEAGDEYDDDRARGRGRGRSSFSEDNEDDAPSRRNTSRRDLSRAEEAPAPEPVTRRRAPEPEPEPEAAAAPPARRSLPTAGTATATTRAPAPEQLPSQEEAAPAPTAKRPQGAIARRTAQNAEPAEEPVTEADMAQDQNPSPVAPPPARRGRQPTAPPPPARRAEEAEATQDNGNEMPEDPATPPTRRAAAVAQPAATGTPGVDEEEDNVPEEKKDPAPPVRQSVAAEEAPPEVPAAPLPRRQVASSSDLRSRLANLTAKSR